MLHVVKVDVSTTAGYEKVCYFAEALELCSRSPAAHQPTARCGCSWLFHVTVERLFNLNEAFTW